MNRRVREELKGTFTASAGWLFADMLLVLTMLFLASTSFVLPKPPSTPTPTIVTPDPTLTTMTPTPTPAPHLEQNYHRFKIQVDPNGLLQNNPNATNAVIQQVTAQPFLRGRQAGLMIAYGGAPDDSQIGRAEDIANRVYNILQNLGKHDSTFANVSRYDPLYLLGGVPNVVTIDIFLFAQ
jgi:hypothetical protein